MEQFPKLLRTQRFLRDVAMRCGNWVLRPRVLSVLSSLPVAPGWKPTMYCTPSQGLPNLSLMLPVHRAFWGQAGSAGTHRSLCLPSRLAGWAASREERGCYGPAWPGTNAQREIEAPLLWLTVGEGCCQLPPHVMRPSPPQRLAHHPRGPAGSLTSSTSSRSCGSPCFVETWLLEPPQPPSLVCCGPTVCHHRPL